MTSKLFQLSLALSLITHAGLSGAEFEGRHGDLTKTNDFDAKANLSGDLQILTDTDGGVYALKIRVHNMSRTNDVVLELFDIPELWMMVSIHARGSAILLSKPRPKLKPYEYHSVEMRLEKASTVEWFIRLSDRLLEPQTLPERTSASLSVMLGFRYAHIGEENVRQSGANLAWLEFCHPTVLITRKALGGDPTEKYEKSLQPLNKQ